MIADSARLSVGYTDRMMAGVSPEQFARFATVGGQTIESNHPAFILGHLSLYPSRVVSELGCDATAIAPTEKYEALFSPQATCLDDPEGKLYPAMEEILAKFTTAHAAAIETLLKADDSAFAPENPNERMRAKFGTIGAMHAFYLGGHMMMHLGQFSAWRRAMGLGAA
ncbi:DinB family protein [Rhodopirellula sp. P2]|uniref:DinB family protein n=1 Tax=Rhodopirellula sp. P2 TaxID=2127060 RepID=UPI0023683FF7|nr:DinB family protein [Rhodopirellula sp. P2]WDQ18273.1 DinB family protein [Rhodopirellula sp. P2]